MKVSGLANKTPPLNKNPGRFLRNRKVERIKTHGHFGKIGKNKNPRAKRAEIFEKMELLVGISFKKYPE